MRKFLLIVFTLCTFSGIVLAQEHQPRMPSYPGGDAALIGFIKDNLQYPSEAAAQRIQGKVAVQFLLLPDCTIDSIKVAQGVHPLLDTEAVRLVKSMPNFASPAINSQGEPVKVWYTLPINFALPPDEKSTSN